MSTNYISSTNASLIRSLSQCYEEPRILQKCSIMGYFSRTLSFRLRCARLQYLLLKSDCVQSIFKMRRANVLHALILWVLVLQLQSANESSPLILNPINVLAPISVNTLVHETTTFVKVCGCYWTVCSYFKCYAP